MNSIEKYYKDRSIDIVGELAQRIEKKNYKTLKYIKCAINNLNDVRGMSELLKQLALIEVTGNNSKIIFKNSLTEIHAACFLSKTLGEKVLEVDSKSNAVISPHGESNKQCDIKTSNAIGEINYYEVKDASSEQMSCEEKKGNTYFVPMGDEEVEQWMKNKVKVAVRKGANYLICRVPKWGDFNEADEDWLDRVLNERFIMQKRLNNYEIIVKANFTVPSYLKGMYILKPSWYQKILFDV